MQKTTPEVKFFLPLLVISLVGFGVVLYSTVWGAGWMTDSFQYVSAAVNFANGEGFVYTLSANTTIPMTHYPPMYSVILSLFEFLGLDIVAGARVLNAVLMGANAFLVGLSLKIITRSNVFSLVGALLVAISAPLVEIHSWVLSEPLFLFFSLLSIIFLGKFLSETQSSSMFRSLGALVGSSILAGFAFLTRYVGITLVLAGLIGLLLKKNKGWIRRLKEILLWSGFSILPMVFWTIRNYLLSGGINDRTFEINMMTPKNIGVFFNTILTWWFPSAIVNGNEKIILVVAGVSFLVVLALLLANRIAIKLRAKHLLTQMRKFSHPILNLQFLYSLLYLLMILALKNILEEGMGLGDRMLIPLYLSGVILVLACLSFFWMGGNRLARTIILLACVYLVLFNCVEAFQNVERYHDTGFGVSKRTWHESPVIQLLRENREKPVFSNSPQSVYLWTRAGSYPLSSFKAKTERGYSEPSLVIIFKYIAEEDLLNRFSQKLELLETDDIAAIYLYNP